MKLSNIYEQLITEFANNNLDVITQAINDKRLINIYYEAEDGDPAGKGWRRVEPFCVGRNHYGNDVLRAWQEHGVSASYPPGKDGQDGKKYDPLTFVPGWRMFRVDKITNINMTGNDRFTASRPKYNPNDKDMATVYAAVDFGSGYDNNANSNPQPPAPTGNNPVTPTPATAPQQPQVQPKPSSDWATYDTPPDTTQQQNPQDKKAGMFDKWADKFKNLIGYKPK